ncbi:hypothetical protein JQ596_15505 [Bradyrhizobium manausense]|uniref:hypothetical protein n=1 Tax=Bradyrhizobium TaxID=374 RepID=UPI001BA4BEEE|nr:MULTISPECIES: hypothetical protein [Bradyrhizobium]MBR0826952.1 hypothetical protein [Bradyrhizobium manausense]UVO32232.1 hypothetical protein KUF59_17170 [Bradyrhizobium arachidis]
MIVTPSAVHKLITSFATALTLLARPCFGNERATIDTRGFSVTFGEMWHVSTDSNGTILGSIRGEEPPFIVMYYADQSMNADGAKGNMLERMKQSSIADMLGDNARRMVDESKWHRHDTVHRPDGITEEQLDSEAYTRDDDGKAVEVCSFMRFYHGAPHAELYLAYILNKPCDKARAEFDSFASSIIWK